MSDDIYGGVFDEATLGDLLAKAHQLNVGTQTYPRIRQKASLLSHVAALCQQSVQFVAETSDESEIPNLQTAIDLLVALAQQVRDDQNQLILRLQSKSDPTTSNQA
jgi:hypothetical protein